MSYYGDRKRGREDDSYYSNYDDYGYNRGPPAQQRRRYNNDARRQGPAGANRQYSSPYYGSRYDNVMRIKQDLWKCLEPEGSRFKSTAAAASSSAAAPSLGSHQISAPAGASGSAGKHGISREQYGAIRKALEDNWFTHEQTKLDVLTVFSVAVNELVHKHAYFATFLSLLHTHPVDPKSKFDEQAPTELAADPWEEEKQRQQEGSTAEPKPEEEEEKESKTEEPKEPEKPSELVNVALLVLQHLDSNLGLAVSQSDWRSVRFHLRFFALCASSAVVFKPMVDLASLGHVLAQLAEGVLAKEEHGLAVKDEVATAVGEALLLLPLSEATQAARAALKQHQAKRKTASAAKLHSSNYVDHVDTLCSLVQEELSESPFVVPMHDLPGLFEDASVDAESATVTLTSLEESLSISAFKSIALPRAYIRFFDDETTPNPTSGPGYLVRSLMLDLMDLLECNRKECARLLLELGHGHWIVGHGKYFKQKKQQAPASGTEIETDEPQGTWVLDNTIVELLLSSLFASPAPAYPAIFYTSLLVELCKFSPTTVAPAMGKCVRRSYAGLGSDPSDESVSIKLDGEGVRRFAEWFSVHLSNFNFTWRWPEWQGDLELPAAHPKRVLIDRILELEVRLSYFDRIKDTLPEQYKESLPFFKGDAPAPVFEYESKDNPDHEHANAMLDLIRGKAAVDEINAKSDAFAQEVAGQRGLAEEDAQKLATKILTQCILLVGSKSFSHFLNSLERYLQLFKSLSSTASKRTDLIDTAWKFFAPQKQMGLIVLDKLLRYRVLDPKDVVGWIFGASADAWSDINVYELLTNTIDVAQSRIANASAKLDSLRQAAAVRAAEEEQEKQKENNEEDENMGDENKGVNTASSSDEIRHLEKQVLVLQDDLSSILMQSAQGFSTLAAQADQQNEWVQWWVRSWLAQFAQEYSVKLHGVEGSEEVTKADSEAGKKFKAAIDWHTAVGQ